MSIPLEHRPMYVRQAEAVRECLGIDWEHIIGGDVRDQVISVLLEAVLRLDARVKELEAR